MKQALFATTTVFMLLVLLTALFIPFTAYAEETEESTAEEGFGDETDLQINVETITQHSYAGTALTDRYNITILTEESYEQAKKNAAMQEQAYIEAQASLFGITNDSKQRNIVADTAEKLGLFDSSYSISNTKKMPNATPDNTWVIVAVLALGAGTGSILAILIQKQKAVK